MEEKTYSVSIYLPEDHDEYHWQDLPIFYIELGGEEWRSKAKLLAERFPDYDIEVRELDLGCARLIPPKFYT
jgi:hypothetical protein